MIFRRLLSAGLACAAMLAATPTTALATSYVEDAVIPAPAGVTQLIYADKHQRLVARAGGDSVYVVRTASGAKTRRLPVSEFTDIALSADGNYVYASDYGGEWIGYGEPVGEHRAHRLDLATGGWAIRNAYLAGSVESIGNGKLLMQSLDQWISFSINRWGGSPDLTLVNNQWAGVYRGHMKYQAANARVIHGDSGSSSQEITAFKIVNDSLEYQESTGTYGSAQGCGGTAVLSTDGKVFYYGQLAVDANRVTRTIRAYPELIHAASATRAFGNGRLYDTRSGKQTLALGYETTVYGLATNDNEFWAYDAQALKFRHYTRQ